ncbi:ATP-dependent RNA helicase RhlE [Rubricella aquisinus]|uniref:DEAD-box ATP-dependent RNA helicase RhpA n=1 Tax=Rubricella aquisinus TaxID=2028108 RepID=A0A840WWZ2_9RHOB|nr:DEAD/DEAH box helicase [Rubricella aquisinus]MBB5514216.1 ATP-dependent RNA helicase RhlE [Rubricella aquisinus]
MTQFSDLGLSPNLLKTIEQQGFTTPTPIQMQAIPHVLEGRDVMGLAQTGTGKTAAFGLPMVHHLTKLHGKPAPKTVRGLVLAPTRELVNQIAENLRAYVKNSHLRVNVVVGGASIGKQIGVLSKGTDILVATPGRLLDLVDRRAVQLNTATFLVLDEADQMLDLGFIHALRKIAKLLGEPRQTLLFSATMPKNMAELAQSYLKDPVRVEVARPGLAADKVRQSVHFVGQKEKSTLLKKLLAESPDGLSLVFSRTKHGAEKLKKHLVEQGFAADSIHGNKSQGQRERAIRSFKSGETKVLVATDVAARGIDIPGVSHVYNFDLPDVAENYVHRIGRTARAGRGGEAIAFCNPSEQSLLRAVEKLMKISIRVESGQPAAVEPSAKPQNRRGGGGKKPGGQQHRRSNGPKGGQRNRRPRAA